MDQLTLSRARELRKNATREENHLWYDFLKGYPIRFRRQAPFGHYIVDFYCEKASLAIELDGSQHYEGTGPEKDRERSRYLVQVHRIEVLRFTDLDIRRNFEGVCRKIDEEVKRRLPPSVICSANATSPQGGGCLERNR